MSIALNLQGFPEHFDFTRSKAYFRDFTGFLLFSVPDAANYRLAGLFNKSQYDYTESSANYTGHPGAIFS